MSYSEARNHFENATNLKADEALSELANGLKHLSHAVEEAIRTLEQDIRNLQNRRKGVPPD
jgi:signal transduction histidine kinase